MSLTADYQKHTLHFRFEAGTSRGTLTQKTSYIIRLYDTQTPTRMAYGECGPLVGLSYDDRPDFEAYLQQVCREFTSLDLELFSWNIPIVLTQLIEPDFPSILFGFETAMLDYLNGCKHILYPTDFTKGQGKVAINGLIWMGSADFMRQQIKQKIDAGFRTLKLKIGALDFEQECALLAEIRAGYPPDVLTLRADANGAFALPDAMTKLERLATFGIHSIEQPIRAGQPDAMAELCGSSPIAIALDEELIGKSDYMQKFRLLKKIQPAFIILKPTLLGGFQPCNEWIEIANRLHIGWWITSALESNIGLNAIAQYTARFQNGLPQGLGTGQLYHNNLPSPLYVEGGWLGFDPARQWDFGALAQQAHV